MESGIVSKGQAFRSLCLFSDVLRDSVARTGSPKISRSVETSIKKGPLFWRPSPDNKEDRLLGSILESSEASHLWKRPCADVWWADGTT